MARKGLLRKSLPLSKLKRFQYPNNSRRAPDPFPAPADATSAASPLEFSPRFTDPPPDVIRASKRFFVPSAPTSSLVEEARMSAAEPSSSSPPAARPPGGRHGGTATVTESSDPCGDFRRSIKEMVEARQSWEQQQRQQLDWGFMEDLLFAYLQLNDRSVHPYILRAFEELFEYELEFFWRAGLR